MTISAILRDRDPAIQMIDGQSRLSEAMHVLANKRIGAMPVVDQGKVSGIISERDILYGLSREGPTVLDRLVREVMISPAITVDPETPVLSALSLMTLRRIRHLPVLQAGKLVGFVSIGDLVKYRIDKIEAEAMAMRDYIQMA